MGLSTKLVMNGNAAKGASYDRRRYSYLEDDPKPQQPVVLKAYRTVDEYPSMADFADSRGGGENNGSESPVLRCPHTAPTAFNGDANTVDGFQNKKTFNRMNAQAFNSHSSAFASSTQSSNLISSASTASAATSAATADKLMTSASTSQLMSSKHSKQVTHHAMSTEMKQQSSESAASSFMENRNFSRSVSLSNSTTALSASAVTGNATMAALKGQRGFSVDHLPIAEEMAVVPSEMDMDNPVPIVEHPHSPLSSPLALNQHPGLPVIDGASLAGTANEMKFEQKQMSSQSKTKVITDKYSAEKVEATNQGLRRVTAGDMSFEEKMAAAAMKERVDTDSFSAERMAGLMQEQRQVISGGITQQEHRQASAASMKVATEMFTAEKMASSKQEQRQTISSQSMTHHEKHMASSSSSKLMISTKGISKSSQSSHLFSHIDSLGSSDLKMLLSSSDFEDLQMLSESAGTQEVEKTMTKYKSALAAACEHLQSASEQDAPLLLDSVATMMSRAWAVPQHGNTLGNTLADTLRSSGGLDLLIKTGASGNSDLQFASAKVLHQSFTTENCSHVVENGLEAVVSLAERCSAQNDIDRKRVGTGILEQLFKHSEETCSDVVQQGGLKAIVEHCKSLDVETLRHCAAALANLSMYGGSENHRVMVQNQVPLWLFTLAFNDDDHVKYYACLAIASLASNKEVGAAAIQADTVELIDQFLQSHTPHSFAVKALEYTQGQSKQWLQRLIPVLCSDHEEARSLAAFHFAMEADVRKREGTTEIFRDIAAVEPLKKVASSPNAVASKYAAQTLRLIGEDVPHKLTQQVPLWAVEDVNEWLKQVGFTSFTKEFTQSRVDGDLLLQLTEEMLQNDIGIQNGILRKRFMRELNNLKKMSDYSSCDLSNINNFLQSIWPDFCMYTYNLLNAGVDKDLLKYLTNEQLEDECGIKSSIHRLRILDSIRGISDSDNVEVENVKKNLDVFISYRRSNGSQLASLLKVHLQLRNFSVFIDVERLEAGKFDNNLLQSVRQAKHFILVLTSGALDRCINDGEGKDWVHREICAALQSQCNIIPITDNFQWPEPETLPEDMRAVCYFNGVRWIHDYQEACVDKLERFIRGDLNVRSDGPLGRFVGGIHGGTPGTPGTMSALGKYHRSQSNESKSSTGSDKDSRDLNGFGSIPPDCNSPPPQ